MGVEYQEGWFCNKEQKAELNVQLEGSRIFLTEFLSDEIIKKHVYNVASAPSHVIKDILIIYDTHGRLVD